MNSCILSISSFICCRQCLASWSNPCSSCLCLWELFLICSVMPLSVSLRSLLVLCLSLLSWVTLLVHSVQSQLVLQSSSLGSLFCFSLLVLFLGPLYVVADCVSEFHWGCEGIGGFQGRSGTCSLQGPMNGVWVLEQPTCRNLQVCFLYVAEGWILFSHSFS